MCIRDSSRMGLLSMSRSGILLVLGTGTSLTGSLGVLLIAAPLLSSPGPAPGAGRCSSTAPVNYLTENKLLTLEDLQERLSSVSEEFEALSGIIPKIKFRSQYLYQQTIRFHKKWNFFISFNFKIPDRKSTRLNSSHSAKSRMPSSA